MKIKHLIIIQIVLLVGTIIFGVTSKGDTTLALHVSIGTIVGIVGLVCAAIVQLQRVSIKQKTLTWLTAVASLTSVFAGYSLKTTIDNGMMFEVMGVSGLIALVAAIAVLRVALKSNNLIILKSR